jgi:uncharacterized protein (DUF885 family)
MLIATMFVKPSNIVQVGLATAEELTRQKEQLLLTEQRLDDINSTLRNSEKHIQVSRPDLLKGLSQD